eukprot:2604585-Rhodomonas_salina.1
MDVGLLGIAQQPQSCCYDSESQPAAAMSTRSKFAPSTRNGESRFILTPLWALTLIDPARRLPQRQILRLQGRVQAEVRQRPRFAPPGPA